MLAENFILVALCLLGLDSEALFQHLQPGLMDRTATLIHGIINTVVQWCSEQAWRRLGLHHAYTARGQEDRHTATPGTATSSWLTLNSSPGPSFYTTGPSTEELPAHQEPSFVGDTASCTHPEGPRGDP